MTMENHTYNHGQIIGLNTVSGKQTSVMRATLNWLATQVSTIATPIKTRHQRKINRQAFDNMLTLDAAILKDIGVTSEDVRWASKLPLSQNAALELEKIAKANRQAGF